MSADTRLHSVAAALGVEELLPKPFGLDQLFAAAGRWASVA